MTKLNDKKIRWIIREAEKGDLSIRQIAKLQKVSPRRVRQLLLSHRTTGGIPQLKKHRVVKVRVIVPYEVELVQLARAKYHCCATSLEHIMEKLEGIHMPHNRIHKILLQEGLSTPQKNKQKQRSWVRFERQHTNSLWHTDWTLLDNGRWVITFEDDASRKAVGWGEFDEATTEHSVEVLKKAIATHGKPKQMLTGRDVQFYISKAEGKEQGKNDFQIFLEEAGIEHILGKVNHPQTNGKQERLFGTIKRHYHEFGSLDELMEWYNDVRPHMSLDWDNLETPSKAFERKMHHKTREHLVEVIG